MQAILMTLSDLRSNLPVANLLQCNFYMLVQQLTTFLQTVHRMISAIAEVLVFTRVFHFNGAYRYSSKDNCSFKKRWRDFWYILGKMQRFRCVWGVGICSSKMQRNFWKLSLCVINKIMICGCLFSWWPGLLDWQMSNRCRPILLCWLTPSATDWTSIMCKDILPRILLVASGA